MPRKHRQHLFGFTLIEILVVIAIIGILSTIGIRSFNSTQQKGRDAKRKADLTNISRSLEAYLNDYGSYPEDDGLGKIIAYNGLVCNWGSEFTDSNGTIYMVQLPTDPRSGSVYFYRQTGDQYALFALLENTQDPEVMSNTTGNPSCGASTCNYRVTSSNYQ